VAVKEWTIVGVTLALSVALFEARGCAPRRGDVVEAPITLVPTDRYGLECALSRPVGRYRCAYTAEHDVASPPPGPADVLQPYVTTSRAPFLVPGLFEVLSVRLFVARVPPTRRFVARCKLRLVEQVEGHETRFRHADPWGKAATPTWVAEPVSCEPE
jgi:hypothetical protein